MTLAEGAGAPNVLVDARYRAIESVIPRVIPCERYLVVHGGSDEYKLLGRSALRAGGDEDLTQDLLCHA